MSTRMNKNLPTPAELADWFEATVLPATDWTEEETGKMRLLLQYVRNPFYRKSMFRACCGTARGKDTPHREGCQIGVTMGLTLSHDPGQQDTIHTLEFDGGCHPNPGGAPRWAWILRGPDGSVESSGKGVAEPQYPKTNNTAEFFALYSGLVAMNAHGGIRRLRIRGDSKLVIQGVTKRWTMPKSPHLGELRRRIQAELDKAQFMVLGITWVPREKNADTDLLAQGAR